MKFEISLSLKLLNFLLLVSLILVKTRGSQCNGTSQETPIAKDYQIRHATSERLIYEMIVTMDHIYLSMKTGERIKISITSQSIVWQVDF